MASFDVLAALRRSGPPYRMTSGQLAESSLVTTGGITLRVDRLEQAGLVVRERDPRTVEWLREVDGRGLRVIEAAAQAHFANEERMLAGMSADQRAELAKLLRVLEHSISHRGKRRFAGGVGVSADRLTVVGYPGVVTDAVTASDLLSRAAARRGLSVTVRIAPSDATADLGFGKPVMPS